MSMSECAWCGEEVTDGGIRYKKLLFCSDECCNEYQDDLSNNGEPNPEDLKESLSEEDFEDFGYDDEDNVLEEDNLSYAEDDY